MPHRDFDAARAERERLIEPETFTLGGETFTCVLAPALGDALDLADAPDIDYDSERSLADSARHLERFIRKLIVPADRPRWDELLRDVDVPHGVINALDVCEVGMHLAEVYGGRPTGPSSDSSDGREPHGDASSSPASNGTGPTSPTSG